MVRRNGDAIAERVRRLSGECPRVAHYVKSKGAPGFLGTRGGPRHAGGSGGFLGSPGKGGSPSSGFFDPFTPRPTGPQPPSRSLPFSPYYDPARRSFGKLSRAGLDKVGKNLLRRIPFVQGALLALSILPYGWTPRRFWDMSGFRLICRTGMFIPINAVKISVTDPNIPCPIPSQVPSGFGQPLPANIGWVGYGFAGPPNFARMDVTEQWVRVTPAPAVLPFTNPQGPAPDFVIPDGPAWGTGIPAPIVPNPWPAIDPFGALPPGVPVYPPTHIPYPAVPHRRPNPDRDPQEQPGGSQPGRQRPGRLRLPRPDEEPAIEIEITPRPGGGGPSQPGSPQEPTTPPKPPVVHPPRPVMHLRRPPSPRVRERKKTMTDPALRFLQDLLGLVTESRDLLDIFFKSLDPAVQREFQWKGSTALDTLAFVLENLEHVRIGHLVAGIVSNALEDAAFGRLGKVNAKANQLLHEHFGIDLRGRLPKAYLNENPVLTP